jgi:two-component system NarL family sensor kinase
MKRSAEALRGAARDLRTLIIQIAPPEIQVEGLSAAIGPLIDPFIESGVDVHVEIDDMPHLTKPDLELAFRVTQEAIRNVTRHAHANRVTVRISATSSGTVLSIEDDGDGFTPTQVEERRRQGHVGTRGISELAAERGGTLTIESSPGAGTRVTLTLPNRKSEE